MNINKESFEAFILFAAFVACLLIQYGRGVTQARKADKIKQEFGD
jgi:hypothetical protein